MAKATQFPNRQDAGLLLAKQIESSIEPHEEVVVLALPKSGVPVAYEVARRLGQPMDVLIVRKLGFPGNHEYPIGALAEGGMKIANEKALELLPKDQWNQVIAKEQLELERRINTYRSGKSLLELTNKTVIIVDDGLAAGETMLAAIKTVKEKAPSRVIVAAPVGDRSTCQEVLSVVDEVVCLRIPDPFYGTSSWYRSFPETSDELVIHLLDQAQHELNSRAP